MLCIRTSDVAGKLR
ncbi:unnamed protein product, partial [Allacma fusca]